MEVLRLLSVDPELVFICVGVLLPFGALCHYPLAARGVGAISYVFIYCVI